MLKTWQYMIIGKFTRGHTGKIGNCAPKSSKIYHEIYYVEHNKTAQLIMQ